LGRDIVHRLVLVRKILPTFALVLLTYFLSISHRNPTFDDMLHPVHSQLFRVFVLLGFVGLFAQAATAQCSFTLSNVAITTATCNQANGSISLTHAGAAPFTYDWAVTTGPLTQNANPAINLPFGIYSVTITDAAGCTATRNGMIVNNSPGPVVTVAASNDTCSTGVGSAAASIGATGTAPFTYQWNDPSASTTPTIGPVPTGTYTVTVTDATGCTATRAANINFFDGLNATISTTNVSCNSPTGSAVVTIANGFAAQATYNWLGSGTSTAAISGLAVGTYDVVVTAGQCQRTLTATIADDSRVLFTTTVVSAPTCADSNGT
jgi:hypothetical protein